jgi:glycosyltransferase involved in cell wall biosynthesis
LTRVTRWLGPEGPPVEYIPFGIDEHFFAYADYPAEPLIVSVGGDRDRDTHTLFQALAAVVAARPHVRAVVQTSSKLPPPDGVTVVPHLSHTQLRELYGLASVVAIATRPNIHASGMTVSLEAMSTGRPVVITSTPGLEDYIDHGQTGALVKSATPKALADELINYLDDPSEGRAAGERGRAKVLRDHRSATMADRLARFTKESIGH